MYPKNISFQKGHLCGCMSTMWLTNTHYLTWMLSGRSWWWFQNMKKKKTCLHIHRCAKGTILFDRPGRKKTPDVAVLRRQSFQFFLFFIFSDLNFNDDASFAGRPMPAKRPWCSQFSQRFNSLSFTFFSLVNCIVKLHALSNPRVSFMLISVRFWARSLRRRWSSPTGSSSCSTTSWWTASLGRVSRSSRVGSLLWVTKPLMLAVYNMCISA